MTTYLQLALGMTTKQTEAVQKIIAEQEETQEFEPVILGSVGVSLNVSIDNDVVKYTCGFAL